jgi:hypothetical protein
MDNNPGRNLRARKPKEIFEGEMIPKVSKQRGKPASQKDKPQVSRGNASSKRKSASTSAPAPPVVSVEPKKAAFVSPLALRIFPLY